MCENKYAIDFRNIVEAFGFTLIGEYINSRTKILG